MLPAILAGASLLGGLFGKAGGGAASERQASNNFQQQEAQRATQQYGVQQSALANLLGQQQNANMQRAQFGIAAPQARMRQALLGSLLQNTRAAQITPPPGVNMGKLSGGVTPDAINSATRAGGGELQRQALIALLTGSDMPKGIDFVGQGMLQAPKSPTYQQAGKLESLLSGAGLAGGAAGALGGLLGGARAGQASGGQTGYNPIAQLPASWSWRA